MTSIKEEILSALNLEDPFKGFEKKEGVQLWGWNGDSPIFPYLIDQVKPKVIIEVGSWMGQSACTMGKHLKEKNMDAAVICIDTWLGSKEHWTDMNFRNFLELQNGYPQFYKNFLTNVMNQEVQDYIIPIPLPSSIGCELLKDLNLKADMIYVDGSHSYKDVLDDLNNYWELLNAQGGIIFGDDWPWDSVSSAVKDFCKAKNINFQVGGINWIIQRKDPVVINTDFSNVKLI